MIDDSKFGSIRGWLAARRAGVIWPVGVLVAVGLLVLLVVLVVVLPPHLIDTSGMSPEARLKSENDLRTTLVQLVGGVVILIGAVVAALTLRLNRKTSEETLELNRQGQITDRFTKAIGQLGDSKLDVRLGGIYALERIARDSADDHRTVMEVLTAFVREYSEKAAEESPVVMRADVSAIVTVLARRRVEHERPSDRINLSLAHLRRFDFRDVHLERALFRSAHLKMARFQGARLEQAGFRGARLEEPRFSGAHLEGADFVGAELQEADFVGAHVQEADFLAAHLEGASFAGAHLEGATFARAHLERADLSGAHLERANLNGAHLEGAQADGKTTWPEGFGWKAAGVILTPN